MLRAPLRSAHLPGRRELLIHQVGCHRLPVVLDSHVEVPGLLDLLVLLVRLLGLLVHLIASLRMLALLTFRRRLGPLCHRHSDCKCWLHLLRSSWLDCRLRVPGHPLHDLEDV